MNTNSISKPRATYTIVCSILVIGSLFFSARGMSGAMIPVTAGPSRGVDDWNISSLNPSTVIPVSTIPGAQCPWINTVLDAFDLAHPGWTYQWATKSQMATVEEGITILDYYAYVVTQPDVTAGDGNVYESQKPGISDLGGAVFNIKYTPVADAPTFADLHWVQAYDQTTKGISSTALDNNGADTPFYDDLGTAGELAGGGGWFLDTPFDVEKEYELNPVSSVQFQVVLADYSQANKEITLYGGEWWGYTYAATEVPEPSSLAICCIAGLMMLGVRKLLKKECPR